MTQRRNLATMLEELPPARKRAKLVVAPAESDIETADQVRRHPLGVRPSGNAYTATSNAKHSAGSFRALPDELLSQILECLDAIDILKLGATCRIWHAFTRNEELWRGLFVEYDSTTDMLGHG